MSHLNIFFFERRETFHFKDKHYNAPMPERGRKTEKHTRPHTLQKDPQENTKVQRASWPNCNLQLRRTPPTNAGEEYGRAPSPERALKAA
jgi:hypothetical protein